MSDGLESARAATRPYTDRIWRRQESRITTLEAEVQRLTEERDALIEPMQRFTHELSMALDWKGPDVPSLAELVTAVRTALAAKDEALLWYRDEAQAVAKNYKGKHDNALLASVQVLANDKGDRARAALGETGK